MAAAAVRATGGTWRGAVGGRAAGSGGPGAGARPAEALGLVPQPAPARQRQPAGGHQSCVPAVAAAAGHDRHSGATASGLSAVRRSRTLRGGMFFSGTGLPGQHTACVTMGGGGPRGAGSPVQGAPGLSGGPSGDSRSGDHPGGDQALSRTDSGAQPVSQAGPEAERGSIGGTWRAARATGNLRRRTAHVSRLSSIVVSPTVAQ